MRVMGSKTAARAAMAAAGVPVVPGYQASQADADLLAAAEAWAIRCWSRRPRAAAARGCASCTPPADLPAALASARREAANAFGDDRIYLEKLIEHPHHIEFQVCGDHHGHAVHLFERECSVQRRHQKIVEETPSPLLDDALRARMGAAAVAAVQAVGYTNAGTLEFLVDGRRNFYFLEMNTRLQVEHPVTELVTGVDLVKLQIRIAAGEPLPFTQAELSQRGHAIECRIYAEDPANNFLPAIGKVLLAVEPVGPGVRVDAGVTSGDEVTLALRPDDRQADRARRDARRRHRPDALGAGPLRGAGRRDHQHPVSACGAGASGLPGRAADHRFRGHGLRRLAATCARAGANSTWPSPSPRWRSRCRAQRRRSGAPHRSMIPTARGAWGSGFRDWGKSE
jgi:hypothetical protein